jgi:hypothetical protein
MWVYHAILITSEPHLSARAAGCSEISGSTFVSNMTTFQLQCDTTYDHSDYIFVDYTTSFAECMDNCITFDSSVPCIAVAWEQGVHGPAGPEGGNLCYGLVNTTDQNSSSTQDSALRQGWTPLPVVNYFLLSD